MKKLIGLILILTMIAGCNESQKLSSDELLKPATTDTLFAQKWVNVYGNSDKSIEHYNMAIMLRIMHERDSRIKKLEENKATIDSQIKALVNTSEIIEELSLEVMELKNKLGFEELTKMFKKTFGEDYEPPDIAPSEPCLLAGLCSRHTEEATQTDARLLGLPEMQTSESQLEGYLVRNIKKLLILKRIDFDDDNWEIRCPECGDAVITKLIVTSFVFSSPIIDPYKKIQKHFPDAMYYQNYWIKGRKQVYCHCGYPLGTDWEITKN